MVHVLCCDCSADSPVLWIRLDPEMTLIRAVDTRQPDFQWQFQLRHERDVTAQLEAIWALEAYVFFRISAPCFHISCTLIYLIFSCRYPTPHTRLALTDLIENEQAYYKVRCEACHCLAKVCTRFV